MRKPVITISMGDPGGIGPEVIVKSLAEKEVRDALCPVIVGDPAIVAAAMLQSGLHLDLLTVESLEQVSQCIEGQIPVYCPYSPDELKVTTGEICADNGRAAHECIHAAAQAALSGFADGICTAPISKEAMFLAGYTFPGHTELLAELVGDVEVRMMLVGGGLRVALETIHTSLANVPGLLQHERIIESLSLLNMWGKRFLSIAPRIGVCGLNPHAGEGGHFGREEINIIAPAVAEARRRDINALGPYSADTMFHAALSGEYDIILAMYHDQGLIPVKTLAFDAGVNVTVGLPFVRTSPDHGTAFPIAWQNTARHGSMMQALLLASRLSQSQSANVRH